VERQFVDEGFSGATLVRPALDRLRDLIATGGINRIYVHSPDRLARNYAYQVLLIDEWRRTGVGGCVLKQAPRAEPRRRPATASARDCGGIRASQNHGERNRRGKKHAAQRGSLNVTSCVALAFERQSQAR